MLGLRHPSLPGENRGTGGPGRAETIAEEEQLLGWAGGEDAQSVTGGDEGGEEGVTAGWGELRTQAEAAELELLFYPGCRGWDSLSRRERGRDVGPGRGEEAGPAGWGGEAG